MEGNNRQDGNGTQPVDLGAITEFNCKAHYLCVLVRLPSDLTPEVVVSKHSACDRGRVGPRDESAIHRAVCPSSCAGGKHQSCADCELIGIEDSTGTWQGS